MKIVDNFYTIMRAGNVGEYICKEHKESIGTAFLTKDFEFTDDVRSAIKCSNNRTAFEIKHGYDEVKNGCEESDLKIIPFKITYEW